jgi:hypothetical protein
MLRNWRLLNKAAAAARLERMAKELEERSCRPPRLMWSQESDGTPNVEVESCVGVGCNTVRSTDNLVVCCVAQDTSCEAVPGAALLRET